MIPVISCAEIAELEKATFSALKIDSRVVMESAGRACVELLADRYNSELNSRVIVFAGSGNNGGDGFVLARVLLQRGVDVIVAAVSSLDKVTKDTAANLASWLALGGEVVELESGSWKSFFASDRIEGTSLIVDAIFGTGFKGELGQYYAALLQEINSFAKRQAAPIFAVDIPSGVNGESGEAVPSAIKADTTLTFQALKPGLINFPGTTHCGDLYLAEIGISLSDKHSSKIDLLESADIALRLQLGLAQRSDSHKGRKGHLAVIGGSRGHYGAPKMSGYGALRAGAGLVTMALPSSVEQEVAPTLIELMSSSFADIEGQFSTVSKDEVESFLTGKDCCVIGPGIGRSEDIGDLLKLVLTVSRTMSLPLVIDADALNILSQRRELLSELSPLTVLTPHPGEMARLCQRDTTEVQGDRLNTARWFATTHQCWVVLKGARSVVASPNGDLWINPAATAALATAGSGDVLAGVMGGLFSQRFNLGDGVLTSVFVHGLAGELLEENLGSTSGVIASDIVAKIPQAIATLLELEIEHKFSGIRKVFNRGSCEQ